MLPEGVAALSVSSATSRHSIHSGHDNATQPHATSMGLQRPYEATSRGDETSTNYPVPQMPDPMSIAPMGLLDFAMEEILCGNDVRRQSGEPSALAQGGDRSRRPRTGDGAQRPLAVTENADSISTSDAYDARQPLHSRTSSSADPLSFVQSLDFLNHDLGMIGGDFLYSQVLGMPEPGGFFNWQGGMAGLLEFPTQAAHPQPRSPDESFPTPESVGAAEHNGLDRQSKEGSTRLPKVLKEKSVNPPRLTIGENTYGRILLDTFERLGQRGEESLPVKNCREVQHLINGYVDYFHRHFPILHLASLVPWETPSPLIWAMCCIGALYRLDRQKARRIYRITVQMLNAQFDPDGIPIPLNSPKSVNEWPWDDTHTKQASQMRPLWLMQTRVLLSLYASLGEDSTVAVAEFERLGMFTKASTPLQPNHAVSSTLIPHCRSIDYGETTSDDRSRPRDYPGGIGSKESPISGFYAAYSSTVICSSPSTIFYPDSIPLKTLILRSLKKKACGMCRQPRSGKLYGRQQPRPPRPSKPYWLTRSRAWRTMIQLPSPTISRDSRRSL